MSILLSDAFRADEKLLSCWLASYCCRSHFMALFGIFLGHETIPAGVPLASPLAHLLQSCDAASPSGLRLSHVLHVQNEVPERPSSGGNEAGAQATSDDES